MTSTSNNSPGFQKAQCEANYHLAQKKVLQRYLFNNVATASMVANATGIAHKNLTRRKRELQDAGLLWEVKRATCQVTGRIASYLTTNPKYLLEGGSNE